MTLFHEIALASEQVAGLSGRLEKTRRLAALFGALSPEEVPLGVAWLSGRPPQGRIGVGHRLLQQVMDVPPAGEPRLTMAEVDEALGRIASESGAGSLARRTERLASLFARATGREQGFLTRLLTGELRQGALESLVVEALALASGTDPGALRRAVMLAGGAGSVVRSALEGGPGAFAGEALELFRPVKPMLAGTAASVEEALGRFGTASFEHKLDGARLQVHKRGDRVRVFTRRLNDETDALPDVVEAVLRLPAAEVVLDGEAIALGAGGRPRPFQETMKRFGRKREVASLQSSLPLTSFFFDVLYLEGEPTIDLPLAERQRLLDDLGPADARAARLVTDDVARAQAFLAAAREAGQEGLMAKDLAAPYAAGRRGQAWLKLKPALTADLVVLAAEWGHGRREGWLSNLHLGARGDRPGELVMVGKTFKGMTDELLAWQTLRLQELASERSRWAVRVRPELVVEVAFDGVQRSPRYPGGVALRFARVKGYREDKLPGEADTLAWLRSLLVEGG